MTVVESLRDHLNHIGRHFPSLSSRVAALKKDLMLLYTIMYWFPKHATDTLLFERKQRGWNIDERICSVRSRIMKIEVNSFTDKHKVMNLITEFLLTMEDIKPVIKELYAIHFEANYIATGGIFLIDMIKEFADELVMLQKELLSSNELATISVQNLRSYVDISKHLADVCDSKEAMVPKIQLHARAVADHTAIFLYSCCIEPDMDHDLKLRHLLQMTEPTNKDVSAIYLEIFNNLNSLGLSEKDPLANEPEMNFIDHFLLTLNIQIMKHFRATSDLPSSFEVQLKKFIVYDTLVKDIVSYSPLSIQVMSIKITLHERIIKHAMAVSSSSFANNSEEEKKLVLLRDLDENFNQIVAELVKSGFIYHLLLNYKKKILCSSSRSVVHSLKGQLEKFSEYMILSKVIVPHPPLRCIFSKIILQQVIVEFVLTISSFTGIVGEEDEEEEDEEEVEEEDKEEEEYEEEVQEEDEELEKEEEEEEEKEEWGGIEGEQEVKGGTDKNMKSALPLESDATNLVDEHIKIIVDTTAAMKGFHDLHADMKYKGNGEQIIGQYIDGLTEFLRGYLSSNLQAIVSVQNLRSFQQLSKVIVNWNRNEDMLNNLKLQLLDLVEHTAMFLCSCWIEPETNHEHKLTGLLQMTNIKNSKVHRIYVEGFESLRPLKYSPWPNELAEASFIDYVLLYLKQLIQCQSRSLVASVKEQLVNLHRYLTVLRNMVAVKDGITPSSQVQYMPSRMEAFHSVVINSVMILATFSINDSEEDAGKKNLELLHGLEESITVMKTELRKSIFGYPSIGGEFFSILNDLEELLTFRTETIAPMKHQIVMLFTDLLKLRSFMDKINDKPIEDKNRVKDLLRRIIQVSCKADFVIQSYVNRDGPTYYHALQLSVVMEDIQVLIKETKEVYDTEASSSCTAEETYEQGSSGGSTPNITDTVVGFEDESEAILKRLIGGSKKRDIVAIVGMPGLGKTTIAQKVYNHSSVARHFQLRAWCYVSQSYQTKNLLFQILRSITELDDDQILKLRTEEIAAKLSQCLQKRRYLIVLDDVWQTEVWKDLQKSFRDHSTESRIIITSRDHHVAEKIIQATPYSYVHRLRVFHNDESKMLLQKKLFPQDGFPKHLSDAGMIIAKKCRGLPLAVVLAAGILSRMKKKNTHWIKFAQSLSTQIVNEAGNECKALIELSYTHLPDHLKCCFLYFGAFPEDKEISARKLAWLWIAEGFVRDGNPERLEDIAEHYLMDLIGRSLVIASKSASRPGIKSCHVHDLLRDFCLAKAEDENFLKVVRGYDKDLPPDIGPLDYGVDSEHSQDPSKITHMQYRLSIISKRKHFIMAKPSGPNVRTLFFHALADMHPNFRYEASFISRYFKRIKVLDMGSINIGDSLTEVASMLHLRYVVVKGDIEFIPPSIANLWELETFILRGSTVALISVPNSIWSLLRLRHLHIDGHTTFNLGSMADSAVLNNMESFSTPTISYGDDVEDMLRRLPNLRKLKCIFLDSWDHSNFCNRFPVLEFLTQLVSLKISYNYKSFHSTPRFPCWFSFPSNLTKLTLSEFGLPWSEISAIGRLPNLNALKLLSGAFTGKKWDMREGDFLTLKYLKLESLDIEEWAATNEEWTGTNNPMPILEQLMLSKCKFLKEIPSIIEDIDTLEIIEVRWCSHSAANSARRIQETAEEIGNDTPKVHIYPNGGEAPPPPPYKS